MNGLDNVFTTVLNMSVTASYAIIALLLIRLLLRTSPKVFSYALWGIVLFRLLCPFSFESPISLLSLLDVDKASQANHLEYIPSNIGYMASPKIHSGLTVIDKALSTSLPAATPYGSVNPMQIWLYLGGLIWLSGIFVLVLYNSFSYHRIKRKLATATLVRDNLYESEFIDTAFVCGIRKPKIYLPLGLEEAHANYILLHETLHIRRYDHIVKPLFFIALLLHWFNPLVWLAFSLMNKDMEMSCDEGVLKEMAQDSKASYSYALLALSTEDKFKSLVSPLAFGESHVKSRIKNVLKFQPPSNKVTIVALILVILLSGILVSNPLKPVILKDEPQKAMAAQLLANKTAYIGNNSKVSGLIQALPLPKGIDYKRMELLTSQEPYTLIIRLVTEMAATEPDHLKANQEAFQDYSALLFALIDNGTIIEWHLNDETASSEILAFNREALTPLYGGDLTAYAKDEDALTRFLNHLPLTKNLHIAELQSDGFYEINQNREVVATFDNPNQEDMAFMDQVIFDFMVKSAAWPGMDVDRLESYILLRRQGSDYYIYKLNGKICIQTRKESPYNILNPQLYDAILSKLK